MTKQRMVALSRTHCVLGMALGALVSVQTSAQVVSGQSVDANGAPQYIVDPWWPGPLPNRWSMQQVTGLYVDHMDHIWFLNRGNLAQGDEIGGDGNPSRILCCVRGPEVIELDQDGNVHNAWGGPGYHPKWPRNLQTVIADREGYVWVGGMAPQDSILKFTRDGELVWDFDHRPPEGVSRSRKTTRKPTC